MTRSRAARFLILSSVVLALLAGFALWQVNRELARRGSAGFSGAVTGVQIGGPFELIDHTGAAVTEKSFGDRHLLIYFGYTFCPDVCPTELAGMATAVDRLGADAAKVQPLFITVDPARDTVEVMADYVGLFHPDLVGLTGSDEQIASAARAYRVYYGRAETDDPDHYLMDHSSLVYLMAPDGSNLIVFPYGTRPDAMADAIRDAL